MRLPLLTLSLFSMVACACTKSAESHESPTPAAKGTGATAPAPGSAAGTATTAGTGQEAARAPGSGDPAGAGAGTATPAGDGATAGSGAAVTTAKDPPAGAAASRSTWQIVEADGTKHGPDETFQLEVVDPAPVAVGGKATFQLKVTPGKSYHVNTCDPGESDCSPYPVKLELTPPAEVQVAKAKLGLGDVAEIDKQHMVLAFDAVPGAAGSHTIAGKFKFAVCQEEACHPRKVEMQFVVAAK